MDGTLTENESTQEYSSEEIKYCNGIIGIPITFMDKYNPEQFQIIDINPHFFSMVSKGFPKPKQLTLKKVGKKDPYARLLIKRR